MTKKKRRNFENEGKIQTSMHVDVLFISHALLYKVNLFYNLCLG